MPFNNAADFTEVVDSVTGIEPIGYESLTFTNSAEAYQRAEEDATAVGGQLAVDPSGGPTAERRPPGSTGMTLPFAAPRIGAVDGARIGLAHNLGGPTAVAAVTILEGPGSGG